ncbi:MAG: phosphoglycerate kinase [Methylocystaceae bacterium]|jgi:phosphoglycerate kinase|nr:phosphoglycerate kinase [Methylocystaceae bacterium]NBT97427.1 phosphoglycerate kinase [Methylocystaceae bacterium]
MAHLHTLDEVDVKGKRVLLRVDLNLPMENGRVSDATRIERVLPTIQELSEKGGKVILLAHFGRPKGHRLEQDSLRQILPALEQYLKQTVVFADDCVGRPASMVVDALKDGEIALLENTRFHKEEEQNDAAFVAELAKNGDIFVNDAFSAAHRAHASTEGLAHVLPAFAGRSMQAELEALKQALLNPQRPVIAIVGGAKVSTKLDLLANLVGKTQYLVIAGGMANTFLSAQGVNVGKSLCEYDLAPTARDVLEKAKEANCQIILPIDVVVAKKFEAHTPCNVCSLDKISDDEMVLDVGPKSIAQVDAILRNCKTLVWNGPFGAFELPPFDQGTRLLAQSAAQLTIEGKLRSIAGGGDTVSALSQAGVAEKFSYVSTAGGAFLEWLEGRTLPGVAALEK